MKNETLTIAARTMQKDDGIEAEARNIRTSDDNRSTESVGNPTVIMNLLEGERIAGCDIRNGDTYFFSERDNRLTVAGIRFADGSSKRIDKKLFEIDGRIKQICPTGQFLVIADDNGLKYAHFDGEDYIYIGKAPEFPTMAFGTSDKTEIAAQISSCKLKCQYPEWRGTLQPDDASVMTRAVNSALDKICNSAKSGFRSIQPLMLRTALRLWDDSLIWSPTASMAGETYVMPEVSATVTALSDTDYRVGTSQMKAQAWKPSVTLLDSGIGNWKPFVKAVEIYATQEQNIFSGQVAFRCESAGQSQFYLRITPDNCGAEYAMRSLPVTEKLKLLVSITDIESFMTGVINADGINPVTDTSGGELSDRTYAIDIPDSKPDTEYAPCAMKIVPRMLTAIGNRCFAYGITAYLPDAPLFESLCAPDELKKGTATAVIAAEVLTEKGKSVVVRSAACENFSERLNGLVTYPDARAVKITVNLTSGGRLYSWSSKLRPNHKGNFAYAVSDTGFFELLQSSDSEVITSSNTSFEKPTDLYASDYGNPLQWNRCDQAHNKGITAVAASYYFGSSWLSGKHSAYLFATDGIYMLSFDKNGHCSGSNLISQRIAKSCKTVTPTLDGIAFIDNNDELCNLSGSKIKSSGIIVADAISLGFTPLHCETLIASPGGLTVAERNGRFYHRAIANAELLDVGSFPLLMSGNNLCSFDKETDEKTEFELRTKAVEIPHGKIADTIVWNISANDADIELTVCGENGWSCCGKTLSRLKVTGDINSPLPHKLPPVHVRTLRLSIKGTGKIKVRDCLLSLKQE